MKTINDLDILAQVLNTLQSNDTPTPETSTESTASSDNTPIQQTILPNDNIMDSSGGRYQLPSNDATIGYASVISNQTDRLTEFPRYASNYQSNENYYNFDNRIKQPQHLPNVIDVLPTTVIPNNEFYYNYNSPTLGPNGYHLTNHNYNAHHDVGYDINNVHCSTTMCDSSAIATGNLEKLKSKSVPDILKELNDELRNSEMKRQRNNSQSITSPVDGK